MKKDAGQMGSGQGCRERIPTVGDPVAVVAQCHHPAMQQSRGPGEYKRENSLRESSGQTKGMSSWAALQSLLSSSPVGPVRNGMQRCCWGCQCFVAPTGALPGAGRILAPKVDQTRAFGHPGNHQGWLQGREETGGEGREMRKWEEGRGGVGRKEEKVGERKEERSVRREERREERRGGKRRRAAEDSEGDEEKEEE